MLRFARHMVGVAAFTLISSSASYVWAVATPLQSAYWRFEEGAEFQKVTPRNSEVVVDSINNNKLRAYMDANVDASPTYTSAVAPKPLKSGLPNNLALDFIPNNDLYSNGQAINYGYTPSGGGFTIEAAIFPVNAARWGAVIAKEGQPGAGNADPSINSLPTLALKTRADNSHLMIQLFDGAKNLVDVQSIQPLTNQQWYYVAAVDDGTQLSLWLDSGSGYELQGSVPVAGAIWQGTDPTGDINSWNKNWSFGRGVFGHDGARPDGIPADWFDGTIDELRLTNKALTPTHFLFAPDDGDFNDDGKVDAADYVWWRKYNGTPERYQVWRTNFGGNPGGSGAGVGLGGAVPEPANLAMVFIAIVGFAGQTRFLRRRRLN